MENTGLELLKELFGPKGFIAISNEAMIQKRWDNFSVGFYGYVVERVKEEEKICKINIETQKCYLNELLNKYPKIAEDIHFGEFRESMNNRFDAISKCIDIEGNIQPYCQIHYFTILAIEVGLKELIKSK